MTFILSCANWCRSPATRSRPISPLRQKAEVCCVRQKALQPSCLRSAPCSRSCRRWPHDEYSPRCSSTKRTARSRTSGEYFGDFLMMAPDSQTKEPPKNRMSANGRTRGKVVGRIAALRLPFD
jgi:hypothetical protein